MTVSLAFCRFGVNVQIFAHKRNPEYHRRIFYLYLQRAAKQIHIVVIDRGTTRSGQQQGTVRAMRRLQLRPKLMILRLSGTQQTQRKYSVNIDKKNIIIRNMY